ncbi:MAG: response regulator [Cyanobacteria bacterium SBLK]|nr:response regulator [Cyanobacteria bacterium SBLK]
MRILLIDEDERLIEVLKRSLTECNYVVDAVFNGEQGWTYGSAYSYDLIILETILPDIDGIRLCQHFRENGHAMPILFLTARSTSHDKIQGLNAGADDYIIKPFDFDELIARIRVLLRRETSNLLSTLYWGKLQLNPCNLEVNYNGKLLSLTAKEYTLLELFLHHDRSVLDTNEIIEGLWNAEESPSPATVRSHLKGLRRKLQQAGAPRDFIETVRGQGYRLKMPSESALVTEADRESQNLKALGTIWDNYQQNSQQQLQQLEFVAEAIATGSLNAKQQEQARLAAHSLAGNLGIFGLERGVKFARELEHSLGGDYPQLARFSQVLEALKQEFFNSNRDRQNPKNTLDNAPLLLLFDPDLHFSEPLALAAKERGIRTTIASHPQQIRSFLTPHSPQFPDAILLELSFLESRQMGGNYQILATQLSIISEIALRSPSLPIITLADRDGFGDRLDVARRGGRLFLRKSAKPEEAIAAILPVLQRFRAEYKVMIVDDDIELLKAMPLLLHPWRFKLTTLDDPRQFWDVLRAIVPDVLILDLEMPYISGIELCQVLRAHPNWQHLPILLLGINADSETKNRAFAIGVDDFLGKPILGRELADRILNRIERVQRRIG